MIDWKTEQSARAICRRHNVDYEAAARAWAEWKRRGNFVLDPKLGAGPEAEYEAFMRQFCRAHAAERYLLL